VIIKYDTGFIIALVADEKFLDVESHSLMLVKTLHLVTLYTIQLLALFPQQKDFLANLKLQAAETNFWNF